MEPSCQVPDRFLVWVQNHLHFKLLKKVDYLGVFATVTERAILKKGPSVAIGTA
jgi:hypothetical protein